MNHEATPSQSALRKREGRAKVFLVLAVIGLLVPAIAYAAATVFDNTTKTFSPKITFSAGIRLSTFTPTATGDLGTDGTDLLFRDGTASRKAALLETAQTFSGVKTYTAQPVINGVGLLFSGTFVPTVNGEIGYDGTNVLFREGGTNKTIVSVGTANTWTALQTYNAGIKFGSFTPTTSGEVGFDGTDLLLFSTGSSRKVALLETAQTFSGVKTFTAQPAVNGVGLVFTGSFTPSVNGEVGYNGTNFLFREGGVNKTISGFTGDLAGNDLSDSTGTRPVTVEDDHGLTIQNSSNVEGWKVRPMQITTTNSAAVTELSVDGTGTAGTVFLSLASNTSHSYRVTVTGRATAGTNAGLSSMYTFDVVARNNAGTTALEGDMLKTIVAEGDAAWDATVEADNTNDRLAVKVTGDAASTIKWVAHVQETTISD